MGGGPRGGDRLSLGGGSRASTDHREEGRSIAGSPAGSEEPAMARVAWRAGKSAAFRLGAGGKMVALGHPNAVARFCGSNRSVIYFCTTSCCILRLPRFIYFLQKIMIRHLLESFFCHSCRINFSCLNMEGRCLSRTKCLSNVCSMKFNVRISNRRPI